LRCTAGDASISAFIDGTITTGARVVSAVAATRSEKSPVAMRWIVVAVAGYTTTRSAHAASATCGTGSCAARGHNDVCGSRRAIARNASSETN